MQIDSQSCAIERQFAAGSVRTALAANKLIRNAHLLSAMRLAFSALTAAASMRMKLPHPGPVITLET